MLIDVVFNKNKFYDIYIFFNVKSIVYISSTLDISISNKKNLVGYCRDGFQQVKKGKSKKKKRTVIQNWGGDAQYLEFFS
jgi:hypothetical protein